MKTRRVAIVGLGLIGGSLGLALKSALGEQIAITGLDKSDTAAAQAKTRGAIDAAAKGWQDLRHQQIVFVCTPVLQIPEVVREMLPWLEEGTIITDAGSTKEHILEQFKEWLPPNVTYIGGHPMAGREKSGIEAADKDLFRGKWYILTDGIHASPSHRQQLTELIALTGAKLTSIQAGVHDRYASYMSHIPHVAAAGLVRLLADKPDQELLVRLMGGGFRDTTRIASSDADMWADICLTNKAAIISGLQEYRQLLEQVVEFIESGDRPQLYNYFKQAKMERDGLLAREGT